MGARLSAYIFCTIWKVDEENFKNYPLILIAKCLTIIVLMVLVPIMIPRNEDIQKLAVKLREEYAEKQR